MAHRLSLSQRLVNGVGPLYEGAGQIAQVKVGGLALGPFLRRLALCMRVIWRHVWAGVWQGVSLLFGLQ